MAKKYSYTYTHGDSTKLFNKIKHLEYKLEYYKTVNASQVTFREKHSWLKIGTSIPLTNAIKRELTKQIRKTLKMYKDELKRRNTKFNNLN